MDTYFVNLNLEYVKRLKEAHKRIRNHHHFPVLLEDVSERSFMTSMFHGYERQFFHYPDDTDLFSIYELTMHTVGYVAGIVCTAQEAANFYSICGNIRPQAQELEVRMDLATLDEAMRFIENKVIYPVSWFRIFIGRNSLETLDKWNSVRDNKELRFALRGYLHYVNNILREEHERSVQ